MPPKPADRAKGKGRATSAAAPKNCYQRGGIWWAVIKLGGIRHRESLRTADAAEAGVRVAALRQRLERTALGVPGEESWQAAVVRWATDVLPQSVKPAVAERYLSSIRRFDTAFGSTLVSAIDTRGIADWITARRRQGRLPHGHHVGQLTAPGALGAVSNASLQRDLTALSSLMDACCAWGWRTDNPVRAFNRRIIKEKREPIRPPAPDDVEAVIAAAAPGAAGILRILAETGMRAEEAVQLERSQIDTDREQILLTRTKSSRPRTLSMVTPAGDATAVLAAGAKSGHLYTSATTGRPYSNFSSNFSELIARVMRDEAVAGRPFRRFRVHDLRHAFAVRWLKNGGSLYRLSRHLGHSSVRVTESSYLGYLTVEEQARVQAEVERLAVAAE